MKSFHFFLLTTIFIFLEDVHSAINMYEFNDLKKELQFKALRNTLRCPECQNNTIADSNSELAKRLSQKVYEMTIKGRSEQEIIDYMVARYGNFVTYNPPLTLATLILWISPIFVIILGFGLIINYSCKSKVR
ncbi:cytochrome c-type biogenesis protein L [Candidatus Photodesmus blepharus]|uniref:Cytochrome c-type biogenesis protein n=1 Tax=Candidatus Photodesmus blepharonis TaxID=1179155 RepID=A0A084CMX9_9GAMM|nr:cytochrome c-type biogenesis protein [Candidatus Photodesmus blepharus]KEY91158.1 cytochrome c-type biogenesis protein L [Candidatus Photodesmus blepharus]